MNSLTKEFNGNILITGVTGFIGRHVLYEFIYDFCTANCPGTIYTLIRSKVKEDCESRLRNVLKQDCLPDYLKKISMDDLLNKVQVIEGALQDEDLDKKIESVIPKDKRLYVIHCAASVNLFNTEEAEVEIVNNNLYGTLNLIKFLPSYICKFIFISTVFSCGIVDGFIGNDYSPYYQNKAFRNSYERYKNSVEKTIINYCSERNIDYQILRPSVVVGRLIDSPLYYISKFDVIYGWTKFFWHIMKNSSNDVIRIQMEDISKVNIVPVDYVAKIIKCVLDKEIKSLNMVYPKSISNRYLYGQMLKAIGFDRYVFVDEIPKDLNKSEKFYYRLIDKVYSPYLNNIDNEYDTSYLKDILGDDNLRDIDFLSLANFAMECDFDDAKLPGNSMFIKQL